MNVYIIHIYDACWCERVLSFMRAHREANENKSWLGVHQTQDHLEISYALGPHHVRCVDSWHN